MRLCRFPALRRTFLEASRLELLSGSADLRAAFAAFLRDPIKQLRFHYLQIIILLDGLDEADPETLTSSPDPAPPDAAIAAQGDSSSDASTSGGAAPSPAATTPLGNKVFQLLMNELRLLRARFIVTARPEAMGGNVLKVLQQVFPVPRNQTHVGVQVLRPAQLGVRRHRPEPPPLSPLWSPGDSTTLGTPEVGPLGSAAAVEAATEAAAEAVAATTAAKTAVTSSSDTTTADDGGGVLMYDTLVTQCALPVRPLSAAVPQLDDLHWAYDELFRRGMIDGAAAAGTQSIKDLLAVLLAAQEPPSESLIQSLGLHGALARLPGFPVTFFLEEHRLYMLHKSLADWLTRGGGGVAAAAGDSAGSQQQSAAEQVQPPPPSAGELQSSVALHGGHGDIVVAGHRMIARQLFASVVNAGSSGSSSAAEEAPPAYTLKYLVRHLAESADAAGLEAVLQRFDFIAEVFRQGFGHLLVRDVQLLRGQQQAVSPALADMQRAILTLQHDLASVVSAGDVARVMIRCPTQPRAFALAANLMSSQTCARVQRVIGWPTCWSPLKMTLMVGGLEH